MADLPGLIENAHQGAGLGHRFLGHVERCSVILHLIDGTAENVSEAYETIRHELIEYGYGLADKPEIIGLNKCDALTEEEIAEKLTELKNVCSHDNIFTLSGVTRQGVEDVLSSLLKAIHANRRRRSSAAVENTPTPYHPLDN